MSEELRNYCRLLLEDSTSQSKNPSHTEKCKTTDSPASIAVSLNNLNLNDLDQVKAQLRNVFGVPTQHVIGIMRRQFRLELRQLDYQSAALTLLQAQAVTFRHQALLEYNKRLLSSELPSEEARSVERERQQMIRFRLPEDERALMRDAIKKFPNSWRVLQISVDPLFRSSIRFKPTRHDKAFTDSNFGLLLTSIDCGSEEVDNLTIHSVPPMESNENRTILAEFQDIIESHNRIYFTDDEVKPSAAKLKQLKDGVDDRLKTLLDTVERKWLGYAKVLFLGKSIDKSRQTNLSQAISQLESKYFKSDEEFMRSGRKRLLFHLLDGSAELSSNEITKGLAKCFNDTPDDNFQNFCQDFNSLARKFPSAPRHAVVLILDREVQSFPWESMSCFQGQVFHQSFTRVPSFQFLQILYAEHRKFETMEGIRNDRIFYVLNPDKNLHLTEKRLEPQFRKLNIGPGVVGEQPTLDQMKSVLSSWDAYMYCGHGANLKNVPSSEIEKLRIKAIPLIMGCSSGKMERLGRHLDPIGAVSHYLIATTPRMLGFLWAITDRDVDNWTVKFLEHWIGDGNGVHERDFTQAVANLRTAFDRFVNSSALVVYGLPSGDF